MDGNNPFRAILGNPILARAILSNPAFAQAILSNPALAQQLLNPQPFGNNLLNPQPVGGNPLAPQLLGNDKHTYGPLVGNEIRLFTLHPSPDFCSELRGSLRRVNLGSPPPYKALSYVWGKGIPGDAINIITGVTIGHLSITAHLANILRYIREPHAEQDLWIDAVCIDQSNDLGKGHQVARMRDIYRKCEVDIAWLGDPSSNDEQLLRIEQDMDVIAEATKGSGNMRLRTPGKLVFGVRLWSRVWIVQELASARNVILRLRNAQLSWDAISTHIATFGSHPPFHRAEPICSLRRKMHAGELETTLSDTLFAFCNREAGNPSDMVNALLGIVGQHHDLAPDYVSSTGVVFAKATEAQKTSWAVHFAWPLRGIGRLRTGISIMSRAPRDFCAGGDFDERSWKVLNGAVLQLDGYLLGEIGPGTWGCDLTDGVCGATSEPKFRALWRTMTIDCEQVGPLGANGQAEAVFRQAQLFREESGYPAGIDTFSPWCYWLEIARDWKFYRSDWGFFVMARTQARDGGFIAIAKGAKVPLILREVACRKTCGGLCGGHPHFEMVSPAYVHGVMDGEIASLAASSLVTTSRLFIP
ncbi:hypothetical protein MAPG_02678 [Magnaporthiopsis poae ATCC 64411]|uniref:Heterokaryon incompatibility domain-containing protein n=1 Tax=Magnaporthiopsis poae (strain ATCC 64411 / 73-15) TaxID=644358 RepID=A0A0C4DS09_MAGP6|nr:hypothetical protein MAPG_02678 [Magnaporthiopsis poae ATCC 64411]